MKSRQNEGTGLSNLTTFKFNGLSPKTKFDNVNEYFSQFGQEIYIVLDLNRYLSRTGFFFVTVASTNVAELLSTIPIHIIGKSECYLSKPRKPE